LLKGNFTLINTKEAIIMTKKILVGSFFIFACIALLGAPAAFAGDALKVGAYGGYFKDSFDKHIYPDFTKTNTSIRISPKKRAFKLNPSPNPPAKPGWYSWNRPPVPGRRPLTFP
jgi:hypothetical protein